MPLEKMLQHPNSRHQPVILTEFIDLIFLSRFQGLKVRKIFGKIVSQVSVTLSDVIDPQ